jgi:hypothetical protein
MRKLIPHLTALAIALAAGSYLVFAQQPGRGGPPPPMSFFITSVPKGDGANYGGVAGADAYCQQLATAAGRGSPVTWHAYLSTQGGGAVNARDRIGNGPWYNANGQMVGRSVAQIHGDDINDARLGVAFGKQLSLTEKKGIVNGVGDMPNQHDILTGSQPDGPTPTEWITPATTGRATAWERLSSATPTSRAAATDRGIPPTPAVAAARRTWSARGGRGCSTVSRSTRHTEGSQVPRFQVQGSGSNQNLEPGTWNPGNLPVRCPV